MRGLDDCEPDAAAVLGIAVLGDVVAERVEAVVFRAAVGALDDELLVLGEARDGDDRALDVGRRLRARAPAPLTALTRSQPSRPPQQGARIHTRPMSATTAPRTFSRTPHALPPLRRGASRHLANNRAIVIALDRAIHEAQSRASLRRLVGMPRGSP
jgi:hypothetical protein